MTAVPPSFDPATLPVALRVRNLGVSTEFFRDLFGLEPAPDHAATGASVVLVSPLPGRRQFGIKLTTEPVAVRLSGVHVQLESANDLLDLYFLALLAGVPTSELRFRHGSLTATITDPDGHTIEVEADARQRAARVWPPMRQAGGVRSVPGRIADPGRRIPAEEETPAGRAPARADRRSGTTRN